MDKERVAEILVEIGTLLELKGENPFKTRAYTNAARALEGLSESLETLVAENGRLIPSRLYTVNQHDILTGSQADGTAFPPEKDMTCGNWTKSGEGSAMVGHGDRMGLRDDDASRSWNASHPSRGCNQDALRATGGSGLFYCFATR